MITITQTTLNTYDINERRITIYFLPYCFSPQTSYKTFLDPRVDTWLFMQSPYLIMTILTAYLYFVLKLGPKLMQKRKPMELKLALIAYNAFQVLFSIFLCYSGIQTARNVPMFLTYSCRSAAPNQKFQNSLSNAAWWYLFSKLMELLDTIFFVLRKKQSQVTFLHVYHHTAMVVFTWMYLKYFPGEQGLMIGLLNAFVHIIMYTYYLIAAMGSKYQKYLWWKKYVTCIQLAQFCILLAYFGLVIAMDCKLSKGVTTFFVVNTTIFLYLFCDFYKKTYKKPKCDNSKTIKSS